MTTFNIDLDPNSDIGETVEDLVAIQKGIDIAAKRFKRGKDRLIRLVGEGPAIRLMADQAGYTIQQQTYRVTAYKKALEAVQKAGDASPTTVRQAVADNSKTAQRTVLRRSVPKRRLSDRQKRNLAARVIAGSLTVRQASERYGVGYSTAAKIVSKSRTA